MEVVCNLEEEVRAILDPGEELEVPPELWRCELARLWAGVSRSIGARARCEPHPLDPGARCEGEV